MNETTWTPEQEAENLRLRFAALKLKGIGQAEFARNFDVPGGASMLSQHIKGRRPLNLEAAIAYAKGFGCSLGEISPRLSKDVALASSVIPAQEVKQNQPPAHTDKGQAATKNVMDMAAARRTTDSAENALRVLANFIRPLSNLERETIANNLRSFALDPDGAVALSSLLAGLDAANARRRYEPPPNSTASAGG